jgi:hypothetical protein
MAFDIKIGEARRKLETNLGKICGFGRWKGWIIMDLLGFLRAVNRQWTPDNLTVMSCLIGRDGRD